MNNPKTLIDYLSIGFIVWFIAWLILSPFLPLEIPFTYHLVLLGIPVAGFFLVKPHRLKWLFVVLLGLNGLDDRHTRN